MSFPSLYRPCVGIALFNERGHVFVGERIDTPGAWQMPQGGIDGGESLEQAFKRELQEEIGTDKAVLLEIAPQKTSYDLPPSLQKKLWDGRYKGQEQSWIAARFTGQDSDIDLIADERPEFSQWKWCEFNDVLDLIVPFKQDTYRQVISFFKHYAQNNS